MESKSNEQRYLKGVLDLHPLLKHYLWVALFTSVMSTSLFMFLRPQTGPMILEANEILAFGMIFIVVSYSFILISGGIISTIIRCFTSKLSYLFTSFLIISIILYIVHFSFSSSFLLLAAGDAILFGLFDTFLSRNKKFFA